MTLVGLPRLLLLRAVTYGVCVRWMLPCMVASRLDRSVRVNMWSLGRVVPVVSSRRWALLWSVLLMKITLKCIWLCSVVVTLAISGFMPLVLLRIGMMIDSLGAGLVRTAGLCAVGVLVL